MTKPWRARALWSIAWLIWASLSCWGQSTYDEALAAFSSERYAEASTSLEALLKVHPNDAPAHHMLGLSYSLQGRHLDALPHLEKASELDPLRTAFTINLAKLYTRLGRTESAATVLKRSLELSATADVAEALGLVRLNENDWKNAAAAFQLAIGLEATKASAWYHLGLVNRAMGNLDVALSSFQRARKFAPNDAPCLLQEGIIALLRGDLAEAKSRLGQAKYIAPNSAEVFRYLSETYLRAGEIEAALTSAQRAVQLAPDDGAAHYQLGKALVRAGKLPEADREFETFQNRAPGDDSVSEHWRRLPPRMQRSNAPAP